MGGGRNPHREEQVKGLNNVALAHGKAAIRENSGRPLVRDLVAELLRLELIAVQRDKVSQLSASYEASFGEAGEGPQPEANEEHKACRRSWNAPPPCRQGLKVHIAARLFCGLFRWFFGAPEVHLHAYLHLKKPFQRRGADALRPLPLKASSPTWNPTGLQAKSLQEPSA